MMAKHKVMKSKKTARKATKKVVRKAVKKVSKAIKGKKGVKEPSLMMFYGNECPHCHVMTPLLDRLESELKVKVARIEVWHNEKNHKLLMKHGPQLVQACGGVLGVPCFYNNKTKAALCGEQDYETLVEWAQ